MKRQKKDPLVRAVRLAFTFCVFLILAITLTLFSTFEIVLARTDILGGLNTSKQVLRVLYSALASLPIGGVLAAVFITFPLRPIQKLLTAMNALANGRFEERLDPGDFRPMKQMAHTFNALASELQNTEMLRSDFVNSFSHEFKTPIVSIRGFAKLLMRGDLTEAQRQEYLNVIVDESTRLSNMATNVLNLTKVEKQTILTDVEAFNLSEQVRKCMLLLEKKWSPKDLILSAEFGEYEIRADAQLLEQVWLNLLDNAVKFSPVGGTVDVKMTGNGAEVRVDIVNHGPLIPPEEIRHIYDKFWQGDASRSTEGNGIGLAIAHRIVQLHRGRIDVRSTDEETVFSVTLPRSA
ncbi:MAG: HAMP domain-containing histidine kinase [Clostridia bacterium]|nr:HAMP domain-containing histidine kinase [Clostridia bacterium]